MFFVRSAHESDLKKVQDLLAETWRATYTPLYGAQKVEEIIADWHSIPSLKERLARPHSEFLLADDGKVIGGMAFAAMMPDMAKTVMLHQLYVKPELQHQGVGRDLFAEIETCFPDAEVMRLEVEAENKSAIAFYQAHGLAEVDRTENCGRDNSGIAAIIMEKRLDFH